MDYELTKHARERIQINIYEKNNPKISYDKESKVLSVEVEKTKSADSDINGNVVVDYDKNGKISRINFYEFNFDNFKSNLKALKDFSRNRETALSVK
ncbi:MAG: DUF2283 domain-containing protein [bacterium]|nr:DUF2283 domain-containing protein [bacterium]